VTADETCRILVLSASLRDASLNERLAALTASSIEAVGHVADLASMREFEMGPYDGDVEREGGFPAGAESFRDRLVATDAFVVCSPEYNASVPGVLKNAIDWVSRFRPQPFHERHGLLLSASPSMIGGNRGLWALRVPLEHLGARIYPDMFSLAQAHSAFDDQGRLANTGLQERLETTLAGFMELAEAAKKYPQMKTAWIEFLGERPDPVFDRVE
jgi:chromate reductase, NAD(P)H dehydrogenase (quinone)